MVINFFINLSFNATSWLQMTTLYAHNAHGELLAQTQNYMLSVLWGPNGMPKIELLLGGREGRKEGIKEGEREGGRMLAFTKVENIPVHI